jgi:hypothetical protein
MSGLLAALLFSTVMWAGVIIGLLVIYGAL